MTCRSEMTYPIDYAAEVRASKARHEAKLAEAKAELEATMQRSPTSHAARQGRPRTNAERDRLIYRAAVAGVSQVELAQRYGLDPRNVHRIITAERVRVEGKDAPAPAKLSRVAKSREVAERNRQIVRAYQAGATKAALQRRYKLAPSTLRVILFQARRAGAVIPDARRERVAETAKRNRAMYLAHIQGASQVTLAKRYKIAKSVVWKILQVERAKDAERRGRIVA